VIFPASSRRNFLRFTGAGYRIGSKPLRRKFAGGEEVRALHNFPFPRKFYYRDEKSHRSPLN
jgi:hypothetical protein